MTIFIFWKWQLIKPFPAGGGGVCLISNGAATQSRLCYWPITARQGNSSTLKAIISRLNTCKTTIKTDRDKGRLGSWFLAGAWHLQKLPQIPCKLMRNEPVISVWTTYFSENQNHNRKVISLSFQWMPYTFINGTSIENSDKQRTFLRESGKLRNLKPHLLA